MTSKIIKMNYRSYEFSFPAESEPKWSGIVERWYQLDAAAFGIADALSFWKENLKTRPELVILASPGGSNHTDSLFTQSGATSPSLFVHTLPNIRGSSFCQVMDWNGPVLCIQNDPTTRLTAIREALESLDEETQTIWIVGITPSATLADKYTAYLLSFSSSEKDASFEIVRRDALLAHRDIAPPTSDLYVLDWLKNQNLAEPELRLLGGYGHDYIIKRVM